MSTFIQLFFDLRIHSPLSGQVTEPECVSLSSLSSLLTMRHDFLISNAGTAAAILPDNVLQFKCKIHD